MVIERGIDSVQGVGELLEEVSSPRAAFESSNVPCPGLNLTGPGSDTYLPSVEVPLALRGNSQAMEIRPGPVLRLGQGTLPAGSVVVLAVTLTRNPQSSGGASLLFPRARVSRTAYAVVGVRPPTIEAEKLPPVVQLEIDQSSLIAGAQTDGGAVLVNTRRRLIVRPVVWNADSGVVERITAAGPVGAGSLPGDIIATYTVLQGTTGVQALDDSIFSGVPTLAQAVIRSDRLGEGA